jgi:hypothetical protein
MFFRHTFTTYAGHVHVPLEMCGVVCDNLPTKIAALPHSLARDDGLLAGIMHTRCLNMALH